MSFRIKIKRGTKYINTTITLLLPGVQYLFPAQNGVAPIIHMDPGEGPYAGQTITFYVQLSSGSKVLESNCSCMFTLSSGTGAPFAHRLFADSGTIQSGVDVFSYTFPRPASYILTIEGSARAGVFFPTFSSKQSIQVVTSPNGGNWWIQTHLLHVVLIGAAVAVLALRWLYLHFQIPRASL